MANVMERVNKFLLVSSLVFLLYLSVMGVVFYGQMMREVGWCEAIDGYTDISTEWDGWHCKVSSAPLESFRPEEVLR